jgi:hypothetical protein
VRVGQPGARRRAERAQIVIERADDRIEQPQPGEADRDHRQRERKEEHAAQHRAQGAPVQGEGQPERHDQDRNGARERVERRVREADVKARVVEEPDVVVEADEGRRRAPEPGVRERQAQSLEQRVDAKRSEQRQPRREKEIGGPGLPPATTARGASHGRRQSGSALI